MNCCMGKQRSERTAVETFRSIVRQVAWQLDTTTTCCLWITVQFVAEQQSVRSIPITRQGNLTWVKESTRTKPARRVGSWFAFRARRTGEISKSLLFLRVAVIREQPRCHARRQLQALRSPPHLVAFISRRSAHCH